MRLVRANWFPCMAIAALAMPLPACAGKTDHAGSKPKTLEELASGEATQSLSLCGGTYAAIVPAERIFVDKSGPSFNGADAATKEQAVRAAVTAYLTAVPTEVQQAFVKMGGQIVITDKASDLCAQSLKSTNSAQYVPSSRINVQSCYVALPNQKLGTTQAASKALTLSIVHAPDPTTIRHSGVRVFGFLHAQFYPRLVDQGTKDPKQIRYQLHAAQTISLISLKQSVANAFLDDVAASKTFDLGRLETLLGDGAAAIVRKNIASGANDALSGVAFHFADDPATWQAQAKSADLRKQRFFDFAFAESFDSMHCNADEQAAMKTSFPKTYAAFSRIDRGVAAAAQALTAGTQPVMVSAAKGALGLYDDSYGQQNDNGLDQVLGPAWGGDPTVPYSEPFGQVVDDTPPSQRDPSTDPFFDPFGSIFATDDKVFASDSVAYGPDTFGGIGGLFGDDAATTGTFVDL